MTLTDWNPQLNKDRLMNEIEYKENCLRTESLIPQESPIEVDILMESLALSSTVGTLNNLIKKKLFYGSKITHDDMLKACEVIQEHLKAVIDEVQTAAQADTARETKVSKRLLHAIIGHVTEAGELADAGVKALVEDHVSGHTVINVMEELGDADWYSSIAIDYLQVSRPDIWDRNIRKLSKRFPNQQFSNFHAENRDLEKELQELQQSNDLLGKD